MPGPPVPTSKPKKSGRSAKAHKTPKNDSDADSSFEEAPPPPIRTAAGSGSQAVRNTMSPGFDDDDFSARRPSPAYSDIGDDPQHEPKNILEEVPETTIGEQVSVQGELVFEKLLRIDGSFEGKLVSTGDLIIGRSGTLIGDVNNMGELIIDGKVKGNLNASKIELRAKAMVFGNITCKSLTMDPTCVVCGTMNVHKDAPGQISMSNDGKVTSADAPKVAEEILMAAAEAPKAATEAPKVSEEAPKAEEPKAEEAPAAAEEEKKAD